MLFERIPREEELTHQSTNGIVADVFKWAVSVGMPLFQFAHEPQESR